MVSRVTAPSTTPTVRQLVRRNRDLRLLLAAGLISMSGDWVLSVGLVYTVYAVTGSTLASAGALVAAFIPQVVTGLFAGVFVDRWSRARTMVVGNVLLAIGLLPLLAVHDSGDLWVAYAVLAATAVVEVFVATADSAMVPLLVEEEARMTANAVNGQVRQVSRLLGGSVGGFVAAAGGLTAVVLVDGATFVVAAVLVQLIRTSTRARAVEGETPAETEVRGRLASLVHEWRDGARTVARSRALRVLLGFVLITAVGEGIMGTLWTPFVKDVLHGNAATVGVITSSQAVGGILGGFLAVGAGRRWRPRVLLGWGAVAFGAVDLAIFLYPTLYVAAWPAVAGMILVGFPGAVVMAAETTLMQDHSTDAQRGRIFGLLFAVGSLSLTAGAVCAGFLGDSVGIIAILALQGGGYVVAGLMVVAFLTESPAPEGETAGAPHAPDVSGDLLSPVGPVTPLVSADPEPDPRR
jgi:Na+/melibiose symporter-like transporter